MDWSEKMSCIKCNNGGTLLVCSENGCPLAVHEGCLGCPAKFDDSGCFYCPYCLYKQAVAESRKAGEYALERKKALLVFMDEKVTGNENHMGETKICEENGHNQSKTTVEANGNITSSDNGKSKSNNDRIIDKPFRLDGEEKISNAEKDSEDSSGSKGEDPSLEIHGGESNRTVEEKQVREGEPGTSAEEEQIQEENHEAEEEQIQEEKRETSAEEFQYREEEWETSVEKEQILEDERETSVEKQEEERETSSASPDLDSSLSWHPRAKRGSKRCKPVDKDSDADPERSKRLKQHGKKKQTSTTVTPTRRSSRKSSAVMRTGKVLEEEVGSPGRSRKPEELSFKLASDMLSCEKRKRLKWTEMEEETLRAGVEKYSDGSKNLPWRTILDFGHGKFDATRTPGDLKDKWRNILRRVR